MFSFRIKIKDSKKFKLFCFIIFFVMVIFLQNKWIYSYNYPYTQCITVSNGDSLWNIATRYKSKREDVRAFMQRIKEINTLETSEVFVGQQLKVPISKK